MSHVQAVVAFAVAVFWLVAIGVVWRATGRDDD